jgi:multiple antibiotic resistance protein
MTSARPRMSGPLVPGGGAAKTEAGRAGIMDTELFTRALGALFAIMNPFVALPIFLSLTDGDDAAAMRRTALATTLSAAAMCAAIGVAGTAILGFFGITVDDFRVAGGLVLLLIGLGMLNGRDSPAHHRPPEERARASDGGGIAFYPMAFPMIVGPGTITTLLIFLGQARTAAETAAVAAAAVIVLAAVGVVLYFAATIGRWMSQTLRVVTTRLMGMILAAIAAGMLAAGLKALLPGLG